MERLRIDHEHLVTLEGLQELMDSRGNDIQITRPRAIKVRDPGVDLERLFCELVEPINYVELSGELVIRKLDEAFHGPRFAGRVSFNEHVVIPVLDNERNFPYAYRNGAVNLILPKHFSPRQKQAKRTASQLAVEGQLLQKHPDDGQQRRLIVVSANEPSAANVAVDREVQRVFDELDVEFVSSTNIERFIERVASESHASAGSASPANQRG